MARHHAAHLRRQRQDQRRELIKAHFSELKSQFPWLATERAPLDSFIIFGGDINQRCKDFQQEQRGLGPRALRAAKRDALRQQVRQHILSKEKRRAGFKEVARLATEFMRRQTRPQRKGVM